MKRKTLSSTARTTAAAPRRHRHVRPRARGAVADGSARLLEAADVRTIVAELAMRIAPADLTALMQQEGTLRRRAIRIRASGMRLFADQVQLALECLHDHLAGRCPQIPYYSIMVLAAALAYFADQLDVIPDFLPDVGRLDDAAVMQVACEIAHAGLQRYCTFKGYDVAAVLPRHHPSA